MFEKLKYFSTIFFGTFIIAVGVYFFMNPNHIISGSITGLAVVLVNFIPLSLSVMTLILNIICIILRTRLPQQLAYPPRGQGRRPAAGCTAGEGWYQEEGKPAVSLTPGTVITIPANVKHWHGAKADSWFSHIAVEVPGKDCSNEWCEPVTDEEYAKLNG